LKLEDIIPLMLNCEQTKGQTVYQHGESVQAHYFQLLDYLWGKELGPEWKLPTWLTKYRDDLAQNLHDRETAANYTLYHDCGKPFCRTVDADGKAHFPDHAAVSARTYLEATGDEKASKLIGWDMSFHTASAEEIDRLLREEWSKEDACTLLLAALAELHSNARMFGGTDSTSFKIKAKTIEKRGKQTCKFYFGER
jgi:hypothetical protein